MSPDVRFIAIFFFINKIWCSNYVAPNENSVLVHFMDIKNEEVIKILKLLNKLFICLVCQSTSFTS